MAHTNWLWRRNLHKLGRRSVVRKPKRVGLMLQALENRELPTVGLPDMPVIRQPNINPMIPPDNAIGQTWDSFTPGVSDLKAGPQVPAFAEWTRTGRQSESIVFSGASFDSDATFQVFERRHRAFSRRQTARLTRPAGAASLFSRRRFPSIRCT